MIRLGFLLALSFLFFQCREKYAPPEITEAPNYLVVEGFINSVGETTEFRLSRTVRLDDSLGIRSESNARLVVESSDNLSWELTNQGTGVFSERLPRLDHSKQYRLRIETGSSTYVSDFVRVKVTPLIDSISWARIPQGVRIFANTHDDTDSSRFYQWEYVETWEYKSPFISTLVYDPGTREVTTRPNPLEFLTCWASENSSTILLGTSTALTADLIVNAPLKLIDLNSERISIKYSILVRQRVLSREAYDYLELIRRNSEQLGTIFDPQPTTTVGNIRNLNDGGDFAIGTVYTSSVTERRIFIDRSEVPDWRYRNDCEKGFVADIPDSLDIALGGGFFVPLNSAKAPWGTDGYEYASKLCVFCNLKGGTNQKPLFWP